ncbi:coiled-coil domain-containing protein 134 [Nomia melanderi]|uniref:coiled-coil domain-containing protein 134 n=1 Tax=Nomia melanderi TaxID=2448451 RepID=UPI0013043C26|nr:coiled-coil domain-containing protein 134-like [Nomia melanderi]
MPRVLVYIVVVSVLTCTAHSQLPDLTAEVQPMNEMAGNGDAPESKVYEDLFKKSFSHQRKEHAYAMRRWEKIEKYELLYTMITVFGEKMINVINSSRSSLENAAFNPDDRSLPRDVTVQSALSTVLENTALFGDIVQHFPEITYRILKAHPKWIETISWSLNFTNRCRHLLDEETATLINSVSQELNITERKPGYFIPHRRTVDSQEGNKGTTKTKRAPKKEKRKRGPQMIKTEL